VLESAAAFGEIGLTGRLRASTQAERRLDECAKLGIGTIVAPAGTPSRKGLRLADAETLQNALKAGLMRSVAVRDQAA
jgi:DNA repair protein RadA/Sms